MKTADQILGEIAALKALLAKPDITDASLKDEITAVIGELEWVVDSVPQAVSLAQIVQGAEGLVRE